MPESVSVVVPILGHVERLPDFYRECASALHAAGHTFEFLFIVPASRGALAAELELLRNAGEPVRVLRIAQPTGAGMLMRVGTAEAAYGVILLLPPQRRVSAESLPLLLAALTPVTDAVFATRQGREEYLFNRVQRRLYNRLARYATRGRFDDLGCGVGAIRREALRETPVYGEFLRFLPLLLQREGFTVATAGVQRHPDDGRIRLHRPGSYLQAGVDLFGFYFLARFTERPLRFFGLVGLTSMAAGIVILLILLVQRLQGQGIANRPALLLGTLLLALGIQAVAVGLVAEIIVHLSAPTRRPYRLARSAEPVRPGTL